MDASDRRKRAGSEAADWFARLQAGEMERPEREQFIEWLRESHLHVAEMLRIAQIHGSLERFTGWARIATGPKTAEDNVIALLATPEEASHDPNSRPPSPSQARRRGHSLRLVALAATVLLVVATILVLPQLRSQVIETERGERREVVLADGSLLQIDPQTRLRVKYSDTMRRVFLERGRAVFHVAKNANRPFLVSADDTTVRAVGTAFGVEQRPRGVVVTVAEGKVAVFPTSRSTAPAGSANVLNGPGSAASEQSYADTHAATDPPERRRAKPSLSTPTDADSESGELFLTANQQVTVANSGTPEPVHTVDSARALAWAQGRLIFQNDELEQAVVEFNRYNRVQITVTDPDLAGKPVSGVFNAAEPEAFIAFLQSVTPVEIVRDGDRSITIAAARHH
jgi:transmembrane sensor